MDAETYMKDRVDEQMAWYSRKSASNKKYYHLFSSIILVASALIPFLSGMEAFSWDLGVSFTVKSSWVVGFLGVCVAALTGLVAMMKYQEKWTVYRTTAEALQREKLLFETATPPYKSGAESFTLFVRNIEEILGHENKSWSQIISAQEAEQT